jgi:hypothetical protein
MPLPAWLGRLPVEQLYCVLMQHDTQAAQLCLFPQSTHNPPCRQAVTRCKRRPTLTLPPDMASVPRPRSKSTRPSAPPPQSRRTSAAPRPPPPAHPSRLSGAIRVTSLEPPGPAQPSLPCSPPRSEAPAHATHRFILSLGNAPARRPSAESENEVEVSACTCELSSLHLDRGPGASDWGE